jgi:hypothetical protein
VTYLAAALIVIGSMALAAAASFLVCRLVPIETRRRHHEVGSLVFLQVGVMFAVLLAFVFSEVWDEFNTAAQSINGECGALHGAAMLANALPSRAGRPVNVAIGAYARDVVDIEWPAMAHRQRSARAAEDLRVAIDTAARLPVTAPADVAIRSQIVSLLAEAHAERETRTFQLTRGAPAALWFVLIAIGAVLEGFVLLAAVGNPGHMFFSAAFMGCTVLVLVLVAMIDYPFEGDVALANTDFVKLLGEISAMLAGR